MSKPVLSSYFKVRRGSPDGKEVYDEGGKELIGQVTKIHFIDDPTNISKASVEYDVVVKDERGSLSTYRNLRTAGSLSSSTNDYDETILEANSFAFKGSLGKGNTFKDQNGSIVVVAFFNSSLDKPYISAVLDHPRREGAKREDGIRKKGEFRGIEWEINKNGELIITYQSNRAEDGQPVREETGPTIIKIDTEGDLEVSTNEDQSIKLSRKDKTITIKDPENTIVLDKTAKTIAMEAGELGDNILISRDTGITAEASTGAILRLAQNISRLLTNGDANIICDGPNGKIQVNAGEVEIGDADLEFIVKATKLTDYINNQIKLIFDAHIHPTGVGPSGPPTTPITAATEADIASLLHKTE